MSLKAFVGAGFRAGGNVINLVNEMLGGGESDLYLVNCLLINVL